MCFYTLAATAGKCVCVSVVFAAIRYLSKLIESAVVLLDVMLLEPLDGFAVVHPPEGPLGRFKVLENKHRMNK